MLKFVLVGLLSSVGILAEFLEFGVLKLDLGFHLADGVDVGEVEVGLGFAKLLFVIDVFNLLL